MAWLVKMKLATRELVPLVVLGLLLPLTPMGGISPVTGSTQSNPRVVVPSGIEHYIPIVIENLQTFATPSPFQERVSVNSAQYQQFESPNLQNIEFFSASGAVIPSWLESGNSSATSVYWLKLPGMAPLSNTTVYLGFASTSTNLFNRVNNGEAPQLSPTYAEYDDGATVFNFYYNFAGSTLWSGLSTESGATLNQQNGLQIGVNGCVTCYLLTDQQASAPFIFDALVTAQNGGGSSNFQEGLVIDSSTSTSFDSGDFPGGTNFMGRFANYNNGHIEVMNGGTSLASYDNLAPGLSYPYTSVESFEQESASNIAFYDDSQYVGASNIQSNYQLGSGYIGFYEYGGQTNQVFVQWIRLRAYVPLDYMPLAQVGQYSIGFHEVGLPPGTVWTVNVTGNVWYSNEILRTAPNGSPFSLRNIFTLANGTYRFTIPPVAGCTASPSLGQIVVAGSDVVTDIKFACPSPVAFVQINISNDEGVPTGYFEQMLTIPDAPYANYINSAWGNIEFRYPNSTIIPAWIESGNSNMATNTIVWLDLESIPAHATETIEMVFLPTQTNVLSSMGPVGEAPQLSPTYGEYDNGFCVFYNYYNFAASSSCGFPERSLYDVNWANFTSSGSVTVNDGVTIRGGTSTSGGENGIAYEPNFGAGSPPYVIDYGGQQTTSPQGDSWGWNMAGLSNYLGASNDHPAGGGSYLGLDFEGSAGAPMITGSGQAAIFDSFGGQVTTGTLSPTQPGNLLTGTFTQAFTASSFSSYYNYQTFTGGATGISLGTDSLPFVIMVGNNEASYNSNGMTVYWFRVRAYPPGGVMPSASFGQLRRVNLQASYLEQNGISFIGQFESLSVTTNASGSTASSGIQLSQGYFGVGQMLAGDTNAGNWCITGIVDQWPVGGNISGLGLEFYAACVPLSSGWTPPPTAASDISNFTSTVNAGDSVALNMTISGGTISMSARDLQTGATASKNVADPGVTNFIGPAAGPVSGEDFTGIMTESYGGSLLNSSTGVVRYVINSALNLSSSWMWIDEYGGSNPIFSVSTQEPVVYIKQQPQFLVTHGTSDESNLYEFTTGNATAVVPLRVEYSTEGGSTAMPPPSVNFTYDSEHYTVSLSNQTAEVYADVGSAWYAPQSVSISPTERWSTNENTGIVGGGPGQVDITYFHQYLVTFDSAISGGTAAPSPLPLDVSFIQFGKNASITGADSGQQAWVDAGSTYFFSQYVGGSSSDDRWAALNSSRVGGVNGPSTITGDYVHQYYVTLEPAPGNQSSNWYNEGTKINVTLESVQGWKFVHWESTNGLAVVQDSANSFSIVVNSAGSAATVWYPGFTLVVGPGGSVNYTYGNASGTATGTVTLYIPPGTKLYLTASPSRFLTTFEGWTGGSVSGAQLSQVQVVNSPVVIYAQYAFDYQLLTSLLASFLLPSFLLLAFFVASRLWKTGP